MHPKNVLRLKIESALIRKCVYHNWRSGVLSSITMLITVLFISLSH